MLKKLRSLADSWVMLADGGFTPLPGEQTLYTSPPRTALSLQSLAKQQGPVPYSMQSGAGTVYLTNRRIVYLPAAATPHLQSFTAPILNLHDTRVTAPWFGPNVWTAVLQPVSGGGIPAQLAAVELKITFKDGGAFDFHTSYERVKERLQQAVSIARENGYSMGDGTERSSGRGGDALAGVNMDTVHLDQLPRYEESNSVPAAPDSASSGPIQQQRDSAVAVSSPRRRKSSPPSSSPSQQPFTPPSEPPPGYEEVQRDSIATELERQLRESEDR
ncbi:MAG: hypothetical protein M1820_000330 [Bogoriella megaspora]|nr:MAG: hypothetical protein M1820_000330 [Bogoriella megaspora]